jgi:phage shock protein PspC (stress-responsive transcriptional regulator)
MDKKLYRSEKDYVLGGVAAGLGEYFDMDPILVRLGFVILTFVGGAGPLLYIALWIILPKRKTKESTKAIQMEENEQTEAFEITEKKTEESGNNTMALVLIGIGLYGLLRQVLPLDWLSWGNLWPILLIMAGVYIMVKK